MDRKRSRNGGKLVLVMVAIMVLLTACENDMKNVEDRDYATVLLVSYRKPGGGFSGEEKTNQDKRYHFILGIAKEKRNGEKSQVESVAELYADGFDELAQEYHNVWGKDLSLSHLKILLVAKKDGGITEEFQELLYALDGNEEVARTCPVLLLPQREQFIRYMERAVEPVGSYLEHLVDAAESDKKKIPSLRDYLKVIREGDGLLVYSLEPNAEKWSIVCQAQIIHSEKQDK